jgi:DNA/RNA-binding domain of Phe-tRNA-synthetase-like protein
MLCKPHKFPSANKAERRRIHRDAMLYELHATHDARS